MVKLLKIALLGPYLGENSPVWTAPEIKVSFFLEITKGDHNFPEFFILSKYPKFRLSYESISVLCDILLGSLLPKWAISCLIFDEFYMIGQLFCSWK